MNHISEPLFHVFAVLAVLDVVCRGHFLLQAVDSESEVTGRRNEIRNQAAAVALGSFEFGQGSFVSCGREHFWVEMQ
jgi:hypothetical protein